MRQKLTRQMSLFSVTMRHDIGKELAVFSEIVVAPPKMLDCLIAKGNPADSDQYIPMLERHKKAFSKMPRQVGADGGFASKDNLSDAKELGVKDAAFAKKRGLSVIDMAKSSWVYKKLRNFLAGKQAE